MPHGSATLVLFNYNAELYSFLFGPTTKSIKVGDIANNVMPYSLLNFNQQDFFLLPK